MPTETAIVLPAATAPQPPTETPSGPPLAPPSAYRLNLPPEENVTLNFVAHFCEAKWSNNGRTIATCTDDATQWQGGHAEVLDHPMAEGRLVIDNQAILAVPAFDGRFSGIFGEFPPVTVQAGDHFKSAGICLAQACDVEYALGYYDAGGSYRDLVPTWRVTSSVPLTEIDLDLNNLAGQTVRFVLVVRNVDSHAEDQALWIAPFIGKSLE
jgi:hypothetical protein